MIGLLSPRLWIALAIAAALAFSHFAAYRAGRTAVRTQWDAANIAQKREIQEQAARNRDLQRQSELRYVVRSDGQDHFFVTTVREIADAAAPLASCSVPRDVVRLLNAAASCARGDSPSACGAADEVPGP